MSELQNPTSNIEDNKAGSPAQSQSLYNNLKDGSLGNSLIIPSGLDPEDDEEELRWDTLIDQIIAGNVIPVIGSELLSDEYPDLHQAIIEHIGTCVYKINDKINSFSDIIFHDKFRKTKEVIYKNVTKICSSIEFKPSKLLMQILSIKEFPFVITTSFTPVVENAMRQIWGERGIPAIDILKFQNDPNQNDNICSADDLRKPTVYYMFGKYEDDAHRFVLTDTDMLDFCQSWLSKDSEYRPKLLCEALKGKYLLMLGNNYSDWLFRFIWYSMRNTDKENKGVSSGMLAYEILDDGLVNFLQRNDIFTKKNIPTIIETIASRYNEKKAETDKVKFKTPQQNAEIFISYSRRDSEVAKKLYDELTNLGKRVWYDRDNITHGDKFKEEIKRGIETANHFIAILSKNVERERNENHVYRNEWFEAITVSRSTGRKFLLPIVESGFDYVKAAVPDGLNAVHAPEFANIGDIPALARQIAEIINNS